MCRVFGVLLVAVVGFGSLVAQEASENNLLGLPESVEGCGKVIITGEHLILFVGEGPDALSVGAPAVPQTDEDGDVVTGTYSGWLTIDTTFEGEAEFLEIIVEGDEDSYFMEFRLLPLDEPLEDPFPADTSDADDKSDCPRGKKCCSCEKGGYGDPCTASAVCGADEIPVCDCEACTSTCTPRKPVLAVELACPASTPISP